MCVWLVMFIFGIFRRGKVPEIRHDVPAWEVGARKGSLVTNDLRYDGFYILTVWFLSEARSAWWWGCGSLFRCFFYFQARLARDWKIRYVRLASWVTMKSKGGETLRWNVVGCSITPSKIPEEYSSPAFRSRKMKHREVLADTILPGLGNRKTEAVILKWLDMFTFLVWNSELRKSESWILLDRTADGVWKSPLWLQVPVETWHADENIVHWYKTETLWNALK